MTRLSFEFEILPSSFFGSFFYFSLIFSLLAKIFISIFFRRDSLWDIFFEVETFSENE